MIPSLFFFLLNDKLSRHQAFFPFNIMDFFINDLFFAFEVCVLLFFFL